MALQDDLETEVKNIFSVYSASPISIPSNKGNLYELYIFLLAYKTIKSLDPTARVINPSGNFTFRCSPGKIKNNQFSYVEFTKKGITYELRNGIEVIGYNMYHEIDVCIFEGVQLSENRPPRTNLKFAIECKNHSKLSSLKGEVRKYVGCVIDLTTTSHSGTAGCLHCGIGFEPYFATPLNAKTNNKYRRYLNSYSLKPLFKLVPSSVVEAQLIHNITSFYTNL